MDISKLITGAAFLMLAPAPLQALDAWDKVQTHGELRWAADDTGGAPYVFRDPKNPSREIGFEVDVMEALGQTMHVKPVLVLVPWEEIIPALQRGDADMAINGLEITADRQRVIDFTIPYYFFREQITVRRGETRLQTLHDLKGHRVGTLGASLAYTLLSADSHIQTLTYPSPVESYKDLTLKRTDAVLMDDLIAQWYAAPNPALQNGGPPLGLSAYGIGLRRDSPQLRASLNEALKTLIQNGELEKIYRRWNLWTDAQSRLSRFAKDDEATAARLPWVGYIPLLLKGAVMTIVISILSMTLAVLMGAGLCFGKLYGGRIVRMLCQTYIEVARGTPLLIQLYLLYYGLPNLGIQLNAFVASVIGVGANYAAYEAEIYRAGLLSIPKGQWEAARSIGMTQTQALRHIIVPQALRTILPPSTNDFIALFKDTSLVSVLTVTELTRAYSTAATTTYRFLELGLVTAALYFAMSYPLAQWSKRLERKQRATFH